MPRLGRLRDSEDGPRAVIKPRSLGFLRSKTERVSLVRAASRFDRDRTSVVIGIAGRRHDPATAPRGRPLSKRPRASAGPAGPPYSYSTSTAPRTPSQPGSSAANRALRGWDRDLLGQSTRRRNVYADGVGRFSNRCAERRARPVRGGDPRKGQAVRENATENIYGRGPRAADALERGKRASSDVKGNLCSDSLRWRLRRLQVGGTHAEQLLHVAEAGASRSVPLRRGARSGPLHNPARRRQGRCNTVTNLVAGREKPPVRL